MILFENARLWDGFADADLLKDGDPLENLASLTQQGAHLPAIMQGSRLVKAAL
jgi:hypothetical protein